ncbi:MAG TPA: hypothetical protein VFX11_04260 [Candidatus Kapabacteria bacterium]|nr:hypothetical protein [Candidatus Kapabacteria bacterium]
MTVREEAFARDKAEHQEYTNLKRDVETLRKDLARLSSGLLNDAKTSAEQVLSSVNQKSQDVVRQAEEKIGEKPFLSLLMSFVLGLILAKVLDSRSAR